MKKSYIALILTLALCLTLCACGKDTPETTAPTEPQQTTEPAVVVPENTQPEKTEPAETEPTQIGPNYDAYNELLSIKAEETNWLRYAMTCVFGQPEDIDLYHFFYGGLGAGGWESISEESADWLVSQGYMDFCELQVMPLEDMDTVLQQVFGIGLADVEAGIPDRWRYLQNEDAYTSNHNDTNLCLFTITWVEEYAGNRVDVFYTVDGSYYNTATGEWLDNPDMVLALRQNADGTYQVLANLVAPTK